MDKVLIVGVESVAGSNLAAVLAPGFETTGIAASADISIDRCEIIQLTQHDLASVSQLVQSHQPDQIVFCGSAAQSCWDEAETSALDDRLGVVWAKAASHHGAGFTFVSSDAVFTGPWMSHSEADTHFCDTPQATLIRRAETDIKAVCPDALIVRTNVFGWSCSEDTAGFAETILNSIESGSSFELNPVRHASPILASDLAAVLLKAWEESETGTLHVAGAERINPCQFAERIAAMAGLQAPEFEEQARLSRPVSGFGRGETMLDCRRARTLLGVSMPLIDEGITRMLEQRENGYLEQLRSNANVAIRVA